MIAKREALPTANPGHDYARGHDWRTQASCLGLDVNDFVPDGKGEQIPPEIRRICLACPSLQDCLDFAIEERIPHGVYGATSPRERRGLTVGDTPPILANKCSRCRTQLFTPRARTCPTCLDRASDARRRARNAEAITDLKDAS